MKKVLSLILAGLMTISCAAFVAADDAAAEVAADPYQEYAIEFLESYGIYKGGEGITDEDDIQRYQMALFVARISTGWIDDYVWDYNYEWEDGPKNDSKFDDLAGTAAEHYYGAISYAQQKGIIEGYSATKFGPMDQITYRDALTMVVRTLGYTGLSYPWGYIEEAVELGLTENIDAAYTDPLTRGEVAVIIYNAMFAPTATGKTLAKEFFGVDFGWKNIVIVATDEATHETNVKAKTGYVGFKILEADGKLGATTYFVPAKDLKMEGHKEEIELGAIYIALFTIDGDLATMVTADSLNFANAYNNGRTDDKGDVVTTYDIADALSKYTKDDTYGDKYLSYINNSLKLLVKGGIYKWYTESNELVGIDFETLDIVYRESETSDKWEIAWKYNQALDKYYRYIYDTAADKVYVDWMSEADFADWYAKHKYVVNQTASQYTVTDDWTGLGDYPYASLRLYDTDGDALAEYATYKDYELGYFYTTMKDCGKKDSALDHTGAKANAYVIDTVEGVNRVNVFVEEGHATHEDEWGIQFGWINASEDIVGFKSETGYNPGYVLYDFNAATGEIEVVKYIAKAEGATGNDADSYWFTGLLQAYSTANCSITVDGEKYYFGYDRLTDASLLKGDGTLAKYRRQNAQELDEYLMQYVEVLVVDGLVVDVDLHNPSSDYVVVLDYAGVTSDGYIAVYGYSTVDADLKIWKINSYNGWKQGDYRYNPANADTDKAFDCGTIYEIKSYDAATDSYGVYTYEVEDLLKSDITIEFDNGYRKINGAYTKSTAAHTYIIITKNGGIYATTGDLVDDTHFSVTGKVLINSGDARYVIYADKAAVSGFNGNAHNVGFVLYDAEVGFENDAHYALEAGYDDAQPFEGWYLLGSTLTTVNVFNLLTGTYDETVKATNIDLEDGNVYMTVNGAIVSCVYDADEDMLGATYPGYEFLDLINEYYNLHENAKLAKYLVVSARSNDEDGYDFVEFTVAKDDLLTNLEICEELGLIPTGIVVDELKAEIAKSYLPQDNIKYFMFSDDGELLDVDPMTWADNTTYYAYVLYNNVNDLAIVYVTEEGKVTKSTSTKAYDDETAKVIAGWLYEDDEVEIVESELKVDWAGSYTKENDTITSATIDSAKIYFDTVAAEHDDIAKNGYLFGMYDDHDVSHFGFNNSFIRTAVEASIKEEKMAHEFKYDCYDCDENCGMVNYIEVTGLKGLTLDEIGERAFVRFAIYGNDTTNTVVEGNNFEVVVQFELTATGIVMTCTESNVPTELNEITIDLIAG